MSEPLPFADAPQDNPPSLTPLNVRVNAEFLLDAGAWCLDADNEGRILRRVLPPKRTLFEQIIDYLTSQSTYRNYSGLRTGREAVAMMAVCVRWGSYFAILADRDKPLWAQAKPNRCSRIHDSEMARIQIEASAAVAQWIGFMRSEPNRYYQLVDLALHYLPMPLQTTTIERDPPNLLVLTRPQVADELIQRQLARTTALSPAVEAHPNRVLANAIVNYCWRNGPVEGIHAGYASTYPLTQRRITPSEERLLIRKTSARFAQGILAVFGLQQEQDNRTWPEQVLPFQLATHWGVTPTRWSLTERTREIELTGAEPTGLSVMKPNVLPKIPPKSQQATT
ncbi:MAG: hypothetical protein MJE77_45165 [Proteobacteria bacterium]|nr:hypothetical protein [Pseudomonadota bacterium]